MTGSAIFIRNLPAKTDASDLEKHLKAIDDVSRIIRCREWYNRDKYPLQSAYAEFVHPQNNNTISRDKLVISGAPLNCEIVNMEKNFAMDSLVVVGLDSSYNKLSIKSHFQKFRPVDVTMFPSETKKFQSAVVTFSKCRDRDAALLRAEPIPHAQYRLYPSYDQVFRSIKNVEFKDFEANDESSIEFRFIHNSSVYVCDKRKVVACCHIDVERDFIIGDEYIGDFSDMQCFIENGFANLTENTIIFMFGVGKLLGIEEFSGELPISAFASLNNIVYLANMVREERCIAELQHFVTDNLASMEASGRLRLLPASFLVPIVSDSKPSSLNRIKLLLQMNHTEQDKTELMNLIGYDNIAVREMTIFLRDKNIDFNKHTTTFLTAYRKCALPYIELLYKDHPFRGIFDYLTSKCGGNPHSRGVVSIQASSVHCGRLHQILDYNVNDYFSTRDFPNQWITFTFQAHRISMHGYSYKTHSVSGNGHSRSWIVEGSTDGASWSTIDAVNMTDRLSTFGAVYTTAVPPTQFFSVIRIRQTHTNTINCNNFRVAKMEFFGLLRDLEA